MCRGAVCQNGGSGHEPEEPVVLGWRRVLEESSQIQTWGSTRPVWHVCTTFGTNAKARRRGVGIIVGDSFRRLVSRTLAKHFARAGCECVAHMVQASTEFSDSATADPSTFLWDDEVGDTHEMRQGEGRTRRCVDAFPFQPRTASCSQSSGKRFGGRKAFVCYLDDLCVICRPDRVQAVHQTMVQELWDHARISLHHGETKVWNRGGIAPSGWSNLQQVASEEDPDAVVWRGDTFLPTSRQGLLILGTPLGHDDFVKEQLRNRRDKHDVLS